MNDRINQLFKDLDLTDSQLPTYNNPYDFAKKIQKCSLTRDVRTSTSDSCYSQNYNSENSIYSN